MRMRRYLSLPKSEKSLICCLYNPPRTSKYRWPETEFLNLLTEIEEKANENNCSSVILAGDINFESTEWIGLVSSDNYESSILNKLADQNFTQILNSTNRKQLDVFLTNKPELVINSGKENQFNKNFKSDHQASIISLQIENEVRQI